MTLPRQAKAALAAAAALALLAGYVAAFRATFTTRVPSAADFYTIWAPARLYLTEGWNPYSAETSAWLQEHTFGEHSHPLREGWRFYYPLYALLLIAPLALIADYSWAQAAWQALCQLFLFGGLFLTLRYHQWRPHPAVTLAMMLWTVTFYPAARAIMLGQPALPVFLLTVAAFWLLFRAEPGRAGDIAAGALLAISTIKPQMQMLVIPFLLLWALHERRWGVIAAFGGMMVVLIGASLAVMPGWIGDWLGQMRAYPNAQATILHILTHQTLPLGALAAPAQWGLTALLVVFLLVKWWAAIRQRGDNEQVDWTLGLTLVATQLLAPSPATTHFVVLLFPLAMILRDRAPERPALTGAAMLALSAGLWALHLATGLRLEGDFLEANAMFLPLPILVLALLLVFQPRGAEAVQEAAA